MSEIVDVSIVIPAFNEAKRLPAFLETLISYCERSPLRYEILVVDDGSHDGTAASARTFQKRFPCLSVLEIGKNHGKGYAVKRGLLESRGSVGIFMDADGSTAPDEIEKNLPYLTEKGFDVFIGSRVLKSEGQVLNVRFHRKVIGLVFNSLVQSLLFKDIRDTQCGFKMFKREVVQPLFSRTYLNGFGFDIEVLYLAAKMGYKIKEGPVSWHAVAGSKVNLVSDSFKMFWNILQVRNWHCTPINKVDKYMGPDEYKFMYEMEETHWWFVSHRHLAMRLIESLNLKGPTILDVGAGTGGKIQSFKKLGDAHGIDVSEKAIEFCLKRGLENVTLCPAERIAYSDETFDIIASFDVLEHVSNPSQVLAEFRRVLKSKGHLIISVPAFRFLWSQHDEALCHFRRYEKGEFAYELKEAGFKIDKMSYLFFVSFFVVAPIRLLRRLRQSENVCDTTTLPPKFLNRVLISLFQIETTLSMKMGLPFGTTLYAVARKLE
jgi:dolichyl-phosphate beta-glucosyltransferase